MEDTHWDEKEPLIEGIESIPKEAFHLPQASPGFRESLGSQTCRVVRFRAVKRRIITLSLVAAAYLIGMATTFLWVEKTGTMEQESLVTSPVMEKEKKVVEKENQEESYRPFIEPSDLVHQSASAPPEERVRLLTQAGDHYLLKQYDIERALGCYRKVVNALPQSQQTRVEPEDTWLLAALKDARR